LEEALDLSYDRLLNKIKEKKKTEENLSPERVNKWPNSMTYMTTMMIK